MQQQSGRLIVTTLNVLGVLLLVVVSRVGWFLLLIGIADQGNTARAYLSGSVTLLLPWLIVGSQWLQPRVQALTCVVAALPLVAEIAVFPRFR